MDRLSAAIDSDICPTCGMILAPGVGNCIACLLRLGCDTREEESGEFDFDEPDIAADVGTGPRAWPEMRNYRLLREMGEGGFAVVYAAEQLQPVRREVAVKVVKPGMDTRGVIARFASERQALAVMDHANIARVFDAGTTEGGHAFFAMELVHGTPLTEFCDNARLTPLERIEVFIQVCQAVQHAHQKGIIHRDLKPSNVLVGELDGKPAPKVIDFGIAKATGELRLRERTIFTAFEPFIGTPAYMSPEQADFGGIDIDTRSDIYSLGVMLYELLTGRTPIQQLSRTGLDEMRQKIREERPPRPSTCVSALPEIEQKAIASNRATEPAKLIRTLRGDLDVVTMKALEKDRGLRYASAAGLAAELRRFLEGEPISARAPSLVYQLKKFAGRNSVAVLATCAVAAAITAAAIVSTVEAVRARRAEQVALTEAQKTQETATFLEDAFQSVNPDVARGQDTTLLRGILDAAEASIQTELTQNPEVAAHLRKVIGWTYSKIGDSAKAETNLREAARIAGGIPGDEMDYCSALDWLAYTEWGDHPAQAEAIARKAYVVQTKLAATLDHHSPDAKALATYGVALAKILVNEGRYDEGIPIATSWLAFQRNVLGNNDIAVANALVVLGEAEEARKNYPDAEKDFRQALAIREANGGEDQLIVANALGHLAHVAGARGDLDGDLALARRALGIEQKLAPPGSAGFPGSILAIAEVECRKGQLDEAEKHFQEALSMGVKTVNMATLRQLSYTAIPLEAALEKNGEQARADAVRRDAAQEAAIWGEGHPAASIKTTSP